jgi:hypothetical protein
MESQLIVLLTLDLGVLLFLVVLNIFSLLCIRDLLSQMQIQENFPEIDVDIKIPEVQPAKPPHDWQVIRRRLHQTIPRPGLRCDLKALVVKLNTSEASILATVAVSEEFEYLIEEHSICRK